MKLVAIPELKAVDRGRSEVEVAGDRSKAAELTTIPFATPLSFLPVEGGYID